MKEKKVPSHLLAFLFISSFFLLTALSASYIFFPRRPSLWEQLLTTLENQDQEEKKGFWERLLDPGRSTPSSHVKRGQANTGVKLKSWSKVQNEQGSGLTTGSFNLSTEHLLLRENILSQLILLDRHALEEKEAWSTIKRIKSNGTYRDYEEERFMSEVIWMNFFDDKSDKNALRKLKFKTLKLVNEPAAYFEDFYNAGIACLLNGDSNQALHYLQMALKQWPARGRALGNVYFGLLMSHAIENNIPETLLLLSDFKDYYPDWLHVETYVPDIQELIEIYPKSAILHIVHGRLVQNVHDYATANDAYSMGIGSIKQTSEIYPYVSIWMQEIEEASN